MVQVSNSKDELDRVSGVCPFGLVIVRKDDISKDEEEEMALNQRKGLKDLLVGRKKESASTDALGSPAPPCFSPSPFSSYNRPTPYPQPKEEKKGKGDRGGGGGSTEGPQAAKNSQRQTASLLGGK